MKFLLDENVDSRLATFLREQGHDVTAIAQEYPHSLADRDVLAIALRDGRTLITNDRDFLRMPGLAVPLLDRTTFQPVPCQPRR